jgi:hypothetical protein
MPNRRDWSPRQCRFEVWTAVVIAGLALSAIVFAETSRQSEGAKPSAATAALTHDLSGVWMQYPGGMDSAIDQTLRPRLTPWGQAKFDATIPLLGPRAVAGKENNPILRCNPQGIPKLLVLPNPFEIVQTPAKMLMLFEQGHDWRVIWMDGRALPKDPDPIWNGYSVGRWQGDALVVDTIGFNDKPWIDSYGNPRSEQMRLTERYRRVNRETLELTITINDPKAYAGPWVNRPTLWKLEPWDIAEFYCIVDEENAYGNAVRIPAGGFSPPPR